MLVGIPRGQEFIPIPIHTAPTIIEESLPLLATREIRLLPRHNAPRMHDIKRHQRNPHRRAIKNILIRLMVRDAAVKALAILRQAENNPHRNERQHEVQHVK